MKKNPFFLWMLAFSFFHIPGNAEQIECETQVDTQVDLVLAGSATIQTQVETEVFHLINQNRVANSLPPLTLSSVITTQARNHSLNMANKVVPFGHQGVEIRYANLRNSIPTLTRFGENVAYNRGFSNPAATAVSGWLRSPGHRANIMGNFNLTGVGVAKNLQGEYYFTQIFVKASSSSANFEEIEEFSQEGFLDPIDCICEMPWLIELR